MGKTQQAKPQELAKEMTNFVSTDNFPVEDEKSRVFVPPKPMPICVDEEVRQAGDGRWYSKAAFQRFYGGLKEWRKSKREPQEFTRKRQNKIQTSDKAIFPTVEPWREGNRFTVLV